MILIQNSAVAVHVQSGTHASENAVNMQLADKEHVIAALENAHLAGIVNKCIGNRMKSEMQQLVFALVLDMALP